MKHPSDTYAFPVEKVYCLHRVVGEIPTHKAAQSFSRTPASTDATFPHEKFDKTCKIPAFKQAALRQAQLVIQQDELYVVVSGHSKIARSSALSSC